MDTFSTPERRSPWHGEGSASSSSMASTPLTSTFLGEGDVVLPCVNGQVRESAVRNFERSLLDPRDALSDPSYLDTLVQEDQEQVGVLIPGGMSPVVKRVRLMFKQPSNQGSGAASMQEARLGMDAACVTADIVKKARVQFGCHSARARTDGSSYRDAYRASGELWKNMSQEEKQQWFDTTLAKAGVVSKRPSVAEQLSSEQPSDAGAHNLQYGPGLLCTWNSSWLLDDPEYQAAVQKWIQCPHVLVTVLKDLPAVQALFSALVSTVKDAVTTWKCREYSCCLEISLHSEDVGRCHLHCFLERHCREDRCWSKWVNILTSLEVLGVKVSHSVPCACKTKGRNRSRAIVEGHYYCQARKVGHVMHESTVPVFQSIFPDSKMVMTLWRTRKLTTEVAKEDVLSTRDRAPTVIASLDHTMALEYASSMEKEAVASDLAWKKCPFKAPCDLELEWCRQFAVTAVKPHMSFSRCRDFISNGDLEQSWALRRFKFLIYDGPSRMGKTELAMAWFGAANTLCVNAQDTTSPNLRPMMSGRYSAIVFDEGDWRLCAANKAMFQSSSRSVELSQSQCNDRCYRVLLFRVPMIVCSNSFWAGCKDRDLADWIRKNSCYVRVTAPVFIQERR